MTCGFGRGVFRCDIKISAIYYNDYITLSVRKLTLEDFQNFSAGRNLAIDYIVYIYSLIISIKYYILHYFKFIHFYFLA